MERTGHELPGSLGGLYGPPFTTTLGCMTTRRNAILWLGLCVSVLATASAAYYFLYEPWDLSLHLETFVIAIGSAGAVLFMYCLFALIRNAGLVEMRRSIPWGVAALVPIAAAAVFGTAPLDPISAVFLGAVFYGAILFFAFHAWWNPRVGVNRRIIWVVAIVVMMVITPAYWWVYSDPAT
jgi:hypothetical protein